MKIAIFTDTFLPKTDGVAISIENVIRTLSDSHEFIVFAPSYGRKRINVAFNKNVKIIRFPCFSLPSYPDVKVALPRMRMASRIIDEFRPDLIHIQTPGSLGVLGVLIARKFKIPSVGTYHTLVTEQLMYLSLFNILKFDKVVEKYNQSLAIHQFRKYLEKLISIKHKDMNKIFREGIAKKLVWNFSRSVYDRCDLIIVPSNSIKKELIHHKFKKPITYISNGVDISRFRPKRYYHSDVVKLLHVGRLSHEKNVAVLIRAVKKVMDSSHDTILTIVGDGPALEKLKELSIELGINDNVRFLGKISNQYLPLIYKGHDIFLTASTMETQGLVVLEAMACGLPIVAVDKYAILDIVKHNQNGFLANPFDPDELAEFTLKLVNDTNLRIKMGKRSLAMVRIHELVRNIRILEGTYLKISKSRVV